MDNIHNLKLSLKLDQLLLRNEKRKTITDPAILMEQEKIWAMEDAADKIADAIRSIRRNRLT